MDITSSIKGRHGAVGYGTQMPIFSWAGPMNKGHAIQFGIGAYGTVEKLTMKVRNSIDALHHCLIDQHRRRPR